jgi:crossover junction endodeoxyribonuclease RuvC
MTDNITILGLDPAKAATGWAVMHICGQEEGITASGVYLPARLASPAEMARYQQHDLVLRDQYLWLRSLAGVHHPDLVAIETPFYHLNVKTVVKLAQVGAVLRLAATLEKLPVVEVPPAKRCIALGLAGNVNKDQVRYTVNAVYNLNLRDHNEADAVAIAAAAALEWRQARMMEG